MIDNNVKVGSYAEKKFSFSEADVNEYCELTGDNNPLHTDKEYCKMTRFKTPIVSGMQLATLFSMLISDFIPSG